MHSELMMTQKCALCGTPFHEPAKKRLPFNLGRGPLLHRGVMLVSAVPRFPPEPGSQEGCVALPPLVGRGNYMAMLGVVVQGSLKPLSSCPTDLPQVLAGVPEILQQGAPAAGEVSG